MEFWQPGITLERSERQVIEQAMQFFQGNKTQTAKALDISIRTLDSKLAKYQKEDAAKEPAQLQDA